MRILCWVWTHLDTIGGVFLIPWGMFGLSLALVGWRKFSETSGADVFVILSSLDLEFIVFKERFLDLVYAGIRSRFSIVFAIGLIGSMVMLIFSSRVQRRLSECRDTATVAYPAGGVFICWSMALFWMAVHFFAVLAP